MSAEIVSLVGCAVLSLMLALTTIAIHFRRFGGPMIRSNRDSYPPLDGAAGRVVRAHQNLNESLIPFALIVLAAQFSHVSNSWTVAGSELFLGARVAHAGLYIAGIPEVRSLAYYLGLVATVVTAAQLPVLAL